MKSVGGFLYFVLWAIGVIAVKGFWMSVAAFIVPIVGPYEGVKFLLQHFGIV